MTRHELETQALMLSSADREQLASRLLRSVDGEPPSEVDEAWVGEAERRLDELIRGEVRGIPGDQFFTRIRRDLGWRG